MRQAKPLGYPAERLAGSLSTQICGNLAPGRCTPESSTVLFLKIVEENVSVVEEKDFGLENA